MPKLYDVAILGSNPAGLAAGAWLARNKHDVLVMNAPAGTAMSCPLREWAPTLLFDLLEEFDLPKTLYRAAGGERFSKMVFHDAAMERHVEHTFKQTTGYCFDVEELTRALRDLADKSGATFQASREPAEVVLQEDHAELVGTRRFRAKLLLIAQDSPAHALSELGRTVRVSSSAPMLISGLDVPLSKSATTNGVMHILEMTERSETGLFFCVGKTAHLRVISTSAASGNRSAELTALLHRLQQAGLVESPLALDRAEGAVWLPPAGVALEQEIHAGKRCLLAGSAGGFAESVTGHTLTPYIHSALLAARCAHQALQSDKPQTRLMQFRKDWRTAMADYLRPPNTSPSMLLPLLFVNERLIGKFAQAILFGHDV
jgi:flavin-dependent dehydrogenase